MVNGVTAIPMSSDLPDIRNASHGQWFYNETDRQLVYYSTSHSRHISLFE